MSDLEPLAVRNVVAHMPSRYAQLGYALGTTSSSTAGGNDTFVTGGIGFESRVPLSSHVADLRAEIVTWLADWAKNLTQALNIDELPTRAPVVTAAFILACWRYMTDWDDQSDTQWLTVYGPYMMDLAGRVDRVLAPPERQEVVGDRDDRGPVCPKCGGTLRMTGKVIECWTCRTTWEPHLWHNLRRGN